MNQSFYKAKQVYGETFYQLPKVLFTNPKYKKLSNDAKVAFALLKDRFGYSIKNNWIDEDDNIFFIFTNRELMEVLNCGEAKVIKVKKDLEQASLLFQKRMGLNRPNRLYLLRPEVNASDIYQQALGAQGTTKIEVPENVDMSGTAKIEVPLKSTKSVSETLDNSGTAKIEVNQDKDYNLDTNTDTNLDTQKLNFSTSQYSAQEVEQQNHDLVKNADIYFTDPKGEQLFLEPEAIQLLSFWCRTPQQMHRFIQIILNAKYDVEKDHQDLNVHINLDDEELKPLMTKTLRRYFNALRSDEKHVKDVENYLYGTMQNLFGTWWNRKAVKTQKDA